MTSRAPITGKVARIVTTDELAINRGREQNVRVGTVFEILDPRTDDIIDPDTREHLGSIKRVKARVRVTKVEAKVCLAALVRASGWLASTSAIAEFFGPTTSIAGATGPTAERQGPPRFFGGVQVGDPVEEVLTEEKK